ncbi:unnamed protein product [Rotaria magnacalcarata]|uniref:Uncharacterized protein n=3 Tax=Rotaria magnacalcarata TaxID=392030 RepID=A0A816M7J8_9BILA|nr:unnamed protein product [Rotaria magnacalcarata]
MQTMYGNNQSASLEEALHIHLQQRWKFVTGGLPCKQCSPTTSCKPLDANKPEENVYIFAHYLQKLENIAENMIDFKRKNTEVSYVRNVKRWQNSAWETVNLSRRSQHDHGLRLGNIL